MDALEDRVLLSPYVVTTVADSGPGSLREAILEQASPITFAIGSGVQTIRPGSPLPTIATAGTVIDGTTQPGYAGTPLVVIDGTSAGSNANGLVLTGGNCTIQGLVIDNFSHQSGILIQLRGQDLITGNYIGTDPAGTQARGNANGVFIDYNGTGLNTDNAVSGNLLSGNGYGIELRGQHNRVVGNRIGTNPAGTQALPNNIGVHTTNSNYNLIGGTAPEDRNLISGNPTGVYLSSAFDQVLGNYIGTNAAGNAALPNGAGIYANGSGGDTVGGTAPGAGNVISGNSTGVYAYGALQLIEGNFIGLNAAGTAALPNDYGVDIENLHVTIGGTEAGAGNVISGNLADGIFIDEGSGPVEGNYIGTNPAGTAAIPNGRDGLELLLEGSFGGFLTVGGTAAGAGNLIADNGLDGLSLAGPYDVVQGNTIAGNGRDGLSLTGSYGLIQGNTIGTDAAHTMAQPNHRYGLLLAGSNNTIGGPATAARNVIAGNRSDGVFLSGASDFNLLQGNVIAANSGYGVNLSASADHNVLLGNAIGTTPSGSLAYPNLYGVWIYGSANTIGGTAADAGNLVSGNTFAGIYINSDDNVVEGNRVGTDRAGSAAQANGRDGIDVGGVGNTVGGSTPGAGNLVSGNGYSGINSYGTGTVIRGNRVGTTVDGASALPNGLSGVQLSVLGQTLGGTAAGAGNLISGNSRDGVEIGGSGTSGDLVQGNFIGTDASGTLPLGNGGNGVAVVNGAGNTIGGTDAGAGNVIAFNGNDGVLVDTGSGNAIQQNSIFSSGNLGIELLNGGNNDQAAPVLTAVTSDGSSTTIAGTLTSAPDTSFTLEFYANDLSNPSGFGEGQTFLGAATVTTDDSGTAVFSITLDGGVAPGQYVAATATDPAGDTSAFSASWQLPSTASPSLAAFRTGVLTGLLSPPSAPALVAPTGRRAEALVFSLSPESGRVAPHPAGSFADASVRTAALLSSTGDFGDVGGDLPNTPLGLDLR